MEDIPNRHGTTGKIKESLQGTFSMIQLLGANHIHWPHVITTQLDNMHHAQLPPLPHNARRHALIPDTQQISTLTSTTLNQFT